MERGCNYGREVKVGVPLVDAVREVGKELVATKPSVLAVGNMVREEQKV